MQIHISSDDGVPIYVLGLLRAETGTVRVFGRDPVAVLGAIGYLSEQPELPGWMGLEEFLRYNQALLSLRPD